MQWCEREEPICAGTNKKKLVAEALRILHAEHGKGPVNRGMAMCSEPIRADDIEIMEIPFLADTQGHGLSPVAKTSTSTPASHG